MRVLIVTTWFPSNDQPGRAVFCRRHAEALAAFHTVKVLHLCPPGSLPLRNSGLDVELVQASFNRPGSVLRAALLVRQRAKRWRPDVIHTMGFSSLAYGAPAQHLAPWIHTEHWSGVADPSSVGPVWQSASVMRHALRGPRRVTAVSSYLAESLRPFARAVDVVPNVVDGPASAPPKNSTAALNVLSVGALRPVKDPLLAIRSVEELRRRGRDVRMRWVGSGPMAQEVRSTIQALGLEDVVELVGQVDPEDLHEHFSWSSLFLLASQLETFCVAGAEALMHGRPVVLGAVGGQRDFVTPGTGELVAHRTPVAFADAVEAVQTRFADTDPEALAQSVRSRFSAGAVAEDFGRAYSHLT